MQLSEFLEIAAAGIVGGGIGSAIVLYLSKKLLDQKLAQELHGYVTRYTRLDKQKTDAVLRIHGLMCEIEQELIWNSGAAGTAIVSTKPEERTLKSLNKGWERINQLTNTLNYHALLLDEDIYTRIYDWSKLMMRSISDIGGPTEIARKQYIGVDTNLEEREANILILRDEVIDRDLPRLGEIRKELERKFKMILGNDR